MHNPLAKRMSIVQKATARLIHFRLIKNYFAENTAQSPRNPPSTAKVFRNGTTAAWRDFE
jgi:hypothetical protein